MSSRVSFLIISPFSISLSPIFSANYFVVFQIMIIFISVPDLLSSYSIHIYVCVSVCVCAVKVAALNFFGEKNVLFSVAKKLNPQVVEEWTSSRLRLAAQFFSFLIILIHVFSALSSFGILNFFSTSLFFSFFFFLSCCLSLSFPFFPSFSFPPSLPHPDSIFT